MDIIILTGTLGAGKTSLMVRLLLWLKEKQGGLPRVIINDRGTGSNLDFARITSEVEGVEAEDLLGACIGCGGQDQFLATVRHMQTIGEEQLFVEPTGLFTIDELDRLADQLPGVNFHAAHLVPLPSIVWSASAGFNNLRLCKVICLTHAQGNVGPQVSLLQSLTRRPVVVLTKTPSEETIEQIWSHLCDLRGVPVEQHRTCSNSSCCPSSKHHHDENVFSKSFDTSDWRIDELVGYLLGLGDKLIRFKGVVSTDEGILGVEWAHGSWTQRLLSGEPNFKADLFTTEEVEMPNRVELTDEMIHNLIKGVEPVHLISPIEGNFNTVDLVGPTAWSLLYDMSLRSSDQVRTECGIILTRRCRKAAQLVLSDARDGLDPKMVDYTLLQTAMVWLWWNQEFNIELSDTDRELITRVLIELEPEQVDQEVLSPWMGETYAYLPRLKSQFPQFTDKINRVQQLVSV